jgi:hypothetical protein
MGFSLGVRFFCGKDAVALNTQFISQPDSKQGEGEDAVGILRIEQETPIVGFGEKAFDHAPSAEWPGAFHLLGVVRELVMSEPRV